MKRGLLPGILLWLILMAVLVFARPLHTFSQQPLPTSAPGTLSDDRYIRAPRLGITFINSAEQPADDARYDRALLLGAGWNRWPLYWNRVELSPGSFTWTDYDRLVADDIRHGLRSNAILLGRTQFFRDGGSISGLSQPIFADGSDTPAPGKTINPGNPWARFVWEAVNRYKPGGLLANQQNWLPGRGVSVWEAWNEPDLELFWNGSVADYARLLKITYIVVKQADPNATVLFGGLAYGNPEVNDWLDATLAIIAGDPQREAFNWYMDIVPLHSYSYARRTYLIIQRAQGTLARYGIQRPIWLNESGVPVWDDYPGPTWSRLDPASRVLRSTEQQAANFFVQSTAYAWAAGVEVVFFHQLYDDCGNQPSGTDFPPHNGDLCSQGVICAGDAHGLFRNERDSICYSQHPLPGTPRPAAAAFRMMADVFGTVPFENGRVLDVGSQVAVLAFDRPTTGERIYVLWNRTLEPLVLDLPASGSSAQLVGVEEDYQLSPNDENLYQITLQAAMPDDYPGLPAGEVSGIGGPPFIVVEQSAEGSINPALVQLEAPPESVRAPVTATPGPVSIPRPTVAPEQDTTPPRASVLPLPETSEPTFTVSWRGEDDSGIERYVVWVRPNGGEWQPWLETNRTSAIYTGTPGDTYEFAVWAVDLGGNWSENIDLVPQARTTVP